VQTYSHITIGVRSLNVAMQFWGETIGLETVQHQSGPDEELAHLWGLEPMAIASQALLRQSPDQAGLHLVEFADPAEPVRKNAAITSRLPKNIDIYTQDLPATYEQLTRQGFQFRSNWSETEADGVRFREVHMAGHDDINIVFLQILDEPMDWTDQGFAGIGALVCIADNADEEAAFHSQLLNLDMIMNNRLAGPGIETIIGLPQGSGVQVRLLGSNDDWMGRLEIIEYENLPGENRYPLAKPPALGCLHLNYESDDAGSIVKTLKTAGISYDYHEGVSLIYGRGDILQTQAPGGLRLEIFFSNNGN